jgi:hypothetical protein
MTDVTTTEENLSSRLQSDSAFSWGHPSLRPLHHSPTVSS